MLNLQAFDGITGSRDDSCVNQVFTFDYFAGTICWSLQPYYRDDSRGQEQSKPLHMRPISPKLWSNLSSDSHFRTTCTVPINVWYFCRKYALFQIQVMLAIVKQHRVICAAVWQYSVMFHIYQWYDVRDYFHQTWNDWFKIYSLIRSCKVDTHQAYEPSACFNRLIFVSYKATERVICTWTFDDV